MLFRVIVKVLKPSKKTNDVVAVSVGRKIYKQLKTGRIGKFAVVPDALKLNGKFESFFIMTSKTHIAHFTRTLKTTYTTSSRHCAIIYIENTYSLLNVLT